MSASCFRLAFLSCLFVPLPLLAQTPQSFVSVTPCRVVDTRYASGAFGPPSLGAQGTRSFPLPTGSCGLPANASAYSLNVTVVPHGPLQYISMWPTGVGQPVVSTLNAPSGGVVANAAIVPAGQNGAISVYASDATDVILDVNGYFLANSNASSNNTAVGLNTLSLSAGASNTALGQSALSANSAGSDNTGTGDSALSANTTGNLNTAYGSYSLADNTTGSNNTAIGASALGGASASASNTVVGGLAMDPGTGSYDVVVGASAAASMSGSYNAVIGYSAGVGITGSNNIVIGSQAGNALAGGNNAILIANAGTANESGVVRIGTSGTHTAFYAAGINGVNVGSGTTVIVNSNGQLGTVQSSSRYKQDIRAMAGDSDKLMQLEPVSFRYRQPAQDGSRQIQYGLIAEQVANVYPELVVFDKEGQPESVQYHELPAMLLNELQKQRQIIQALTERLAALESKSR